jgi:hypothetical protein
MGTRYRLFAGVAPGLEHLLAAELASIVRGKAWKSTEGGAEALLSREEMWAVAHRSRVAELLRVRIGEFPATNFPDLVRKLERLPWSAYIKRGLPSLPVVSTVATKSKLIHAGCVLRAHAPAPSSGAAAELSRPRLAFLRYPLSTCFLCGRCQRHQPACTGRIVQPRHYVNTAVTSAIRSSALPLSPQGPRG